MIDFPDTDSAAPGGPYDAVVVGGGLAGAAFATLLRRRRPSSRVLVVERRPAFDRKVGEATVEVSGCFLHRVLGLYDVLSREHLPKHGLRYWFTDTPDRTLGEMSEVGPRMMPRLPSFQLDRARLDEAVLRLAADAGCAVGRPARVRSIELGRPFNRIELDEAGARRRVEARWVIDAGGRGALLARQLGLLRRTEEHPTAAVWCRWRGVADLDGAGLPGDDARRPALPGVAASRRLATNHFCGYGWWCWLIPLAGGETSVGLVYNKELFELPGAGGLGAGGLGERYRRFVTSQPGLRELLAGAEMEDADCRAFSHLAYCAERYAGDGWALVGDAASFLDPYYSPGLDHLAISAWATAALVDADLAGEAGGTGREARLATHNRRFARSYRNWLEALYRDKYELLGDAELCSAAFLFDTAMYHFGVVTPVYDEVENFANPVLGLGNLASRLAYRLMSGFNRRLVRLARLRRLSGSYGRRNAGWRLAARTPGPGAAALPMLLQGLRLWLRVERLHLFDRLRHHGAALSAPVPQPLDRRGAAPRAGTAASAGPVLPKG